MIPKGLEVGVGKRYDSMGFVGESGVQGYRRS